MTLPLDGILVVDFSQFLSGPMCALRLADVGARVIKVERPGTGDLCRTLYISDTDIGGANSLGVRPDDISPVGHGLSQDGPGAEVSLTVDPAEPLGMESLIYTHLAGQEVLAKLCGPRIVSPGEVLIFRLTLDRAHPSTQRPACR